MNADIDSSAIPSQSEAEKFKISDRKRTDDTAFLLVHFEFQCSFEILRARLQEPLCGSFAFRQKNNIVCIADARHSPFQVLLIELIEVDIRQQRREVSSLCRASYYAE